MKEGACMVIGKTDQYTVNNVVCELKQLLKEDIPQEYKTGQETALRMLTEILKRMFWTFQTIFSDI